MPLHLRLSVISTVVVVHLGLLYAYPSRNPVSAASKAMTVSFAMVAEQHQSQATSSRKADIVQTNQAVATPKTAVSTAESPAQHDSLSVSAPESPAVQAEVAISADTEPDYLPAYLKNAAPAYPVTARRLGWQGKVMVSVEVLSDGRAGQVQIAHGSGHTVLDRAALDAVKDWRFTPARQAGVAVTKWFMVPIPFVLKEAE